MKVKLDAGFLQTGLRCPEGKGRVEFCCAEFPGLYLEVRATSSGQGTFYYRWKNKDGKTCHKQLGTSRELTALDARKAARQLRAELALGRDPHAEALARRQMPTFAEWFEEYLKYAKAMKRSWRADETLFRTRLKARFGNQRLDSIKRAEVIEFHTSLLKEVKPATADHYVKCLRRAINYAIELEVISKNPCAKFRLFNPDNRVFHNLTDEELGRLLTTLDSMENRAVANMARWLLASSCRLSECLGAQWKNIDRQNRRWYIPATASKSKRGRWVPLSDTALDVLDQLTTEGRYEYLFINEKTQRPFTSFMRVWRRLRVKAGLPHLRIHDLRSIGLSIMANRGVSMLALMEIAGHSDVRITAARYARMADATLLEAVQVGSRAIQTAAAPKVLAPDTAGTAANEETAKQRDVKLQSAQQDAAEEVVPDAQPRAA